METKLDVFNLAYIRHSVEIEINPSLLTKEVNRHHRYYNHHQRHHHHPVVTNTTTNHHKWWHSLWKTKSHSREGEEYFLILRI